MSGSCIRVSCQGPVLGSLVRVSCQGPVLVILLGSHVRVLY